MFSGDVAQKQAAYEENGERKRHIYCCTKYVQEDILHTDTDSKETKNGNSSYTRALDHGDDGNDNVDDDDNDDDDDDDDNNNSDINPDNVDDQKKKDRILDKNYNCHYKIKAVQMSAIRCRMEEQQEEERKLFYHHQQLQHQKQQYLREDGAQSVINLARSNAMLDAICASEAAGQHHTQQQQQQQQQHQHQHHTHMSYAHPSHIAYTGAHPSHYPPTTHVNKSRTTDAVELTTSHYSNSSSPPAMTASSASTVPAMDDNTTTTISNGSSSSAAVAAAAAAANRRDHNIDYSTLFVQLSGTLPTLYRCVNCNKIVSNRWHHANIHRPQSHVCPVCGQKFTRRDNMKAHCKIKHADIKDHFFSHYVHM